MPDHAAVHDGLVPCLDRSGVVQDLHLGSSPGRARSRSHCPEFDPQPLSHPAFSKRTLKRNGGVTLVNTQVRDILTLNFTLFFQERAVWVKIHCTRFAGYSKLKRPHQRNALSANYSTKRPCPYAGGNTSRTDNFLNARCRIDVMSTTNRAKSQTRLSSFRI